MPWRGIAPRQKKSKNFAVFWIRMKEVPMASLISWLSPNVMQALGWTLIHSLWQCAGLAVLAACVMAISSRPSVRYIIATGALALMLAAPLATLLVLAK